MFGGLMIILRLYIFRTKWQKSSQRQPKLSTHWGQDSKSQSVKKCNHRLIQLLWILSWQLKMRLSSVYGPLVPVYTPNNVWACSWWGSGWCPSWPVPLVKCTDWEINLLVHIYMLGETAVPRGNQCKHRDNIQTPHRKALPQRYSNPELSWCGKGPSWMISGGLLNNWDCDVTWIKKRQKVPCPCIRNDKRQAWRVMRLTWEHDRMGSDWGKIGFPFTLSYHTT